MTNEIKTLDPSTISKLVLNGDMKGLSDQQKVDYYAYRCQQAGLDPAAKPFDILTLNNKMILYANAACTQQLTSINRLSHAITGREMLDDIYTVFCRVTGLDGRSTENMGAVSVAGLKGEAKANAMLKATTKAIRRAVLAHCGLGMMDEETEVETIPGAQRQEVQAISTTAPWSTEELEEFETTKERVYAAYRSGGASPEAFNKFHDRWQPRRHREPAELVLTEMAAFAAKVEAAAQKAS